MLEMLRTALGLTNGYKVEALETFGYILRQARQTAERWGGEIVFVYLPSKTAFINPIATLDAQGYRTRVLDTARRAGIKTVVDMYPVFAQHSEPLSLHSGHYTAEGYNMVALAVRTALTDSD